MTCFVTHLRKKGYFEELGIEVTKENAKEIELEIARIVGKNGEHCPAIWKEMRAWLEDPKRTAKLEKNLMKKFAKG
ncbi:MAG: hypothetical protein A3K76_05850 [Euryarchaeota archaeon RBG_13_57_23]|nr:MAG: hypothetical protein A3K76_05850 [Euryarchaeota archaeon RBG_13_57_23]